MKKKTLFALIIVLLISLPGFAQMQMGVGINHSPIAVHLNIGYIARNRLAVEFEGKVSMKSLIKNASYPILKLGYSYLVMDELTLTPYAGIGYAMHSTDKDYLNHTTTQFSLRLNYKWAYIEPTYIDKRYQTSIGIIADL